MSWSDWATSTLSGVGAPVDQTNIETLWAWSNAESGADVMRWLNPLNTTLPWLSPPSHPMNSVGVQAYLDEASGVAATVDTLLNGYYPVILDHLRRSVPRQQWQDACPNLGTWGTGCGWLTYSYGAAPGVLEADLTPEQEAKLDSAIAGIRSLEIALRGASNAEETALAGPYTQQVRAYLGGLIGEELAKHPAGSSASVDLSPVLAAQSVTNAKVDVVAGKLSNLSLKVV